MIQDTQPEIDGDQLPDLIADAAPVADVAPADVAPVADAAPAGRMIPMRLQVGETIEVPAGGGTIQVVGREAFDWYAGWGTLSLINAALAQGKNRSGLNWWLLSLLLGPAATFLLCVTEKKPAAASQVEEAA